MKFAVLTFLALGNAQEKFYSAYVPQMEYLGNDGKAGSDAADADVLGVIMGCYGKHGQHTITPGEDTKPSATSVKGYNITDVVSFEQECTLFNCYMEDGNVPALDIWNKWTYPYEDCTENIRWYYALKADSVALTCTPTEVCSRVMPTIRSTGINAKVDASALNDTQAIETTCMKEVLTANLHPVDAQLTRAASLPFQLGCEMNNCYHKEAAKVSLWSAGKMSYPAAECTAYQTEYKTLNTTHTDLTCTPVECSAAFFMKPVWGASIFLLFVYLF